MSLAQMKAESRQKPKQVIVVRKDLKMRSGKIAAQVAHASMGVLLNAGRYDEFTDENKIIQQAFVLNLKHRPAMCEWLRGAFTKVCVSCDSEAELLELEQAAISAGIVNCLITDSGLTEFNGVPTRTCLAIGPDYSDRIDPITKHLKLL